MGSSIFIREPPARAAFILDQGFSYSRDHWTSRLPHERQWPTNLDRRPTGPKWPSLDRRGVFALADVQKPQDAVHLYVAAYVWGTGLSARGVSRRVNCCATTPKPDRTSWPPSPTCAKTGPFPPTAPSTGVELTG
jgi:hypothetical protein